MSYAFYIFQERHLTDFIQLWQISNAPSNRCQPILQVGVAFITV